MRLAALASLVLLGCGADRGAAPQPVADVKQVMISILEPAAEVYWDASGSVIDSTGIHELAPRTDEEWAAVWRAALVIAESGNLLMLDGHVAWRKFEKMLPRNTTPNAPIYWW